MVPITNITGRLGNQMFETAFLYAWARDNGMPLVDDGLGYYYQDPSHFEKYSEEIKNLFGANIIPSDYVGIHVRRGDYVNHHFYVDLMKTDYYQKAIAEFPEDTKFMLFSDDWFGIKDHPMFEKVKYSPWYSENTTDDHTLESFNEMAGCKGLITANSSYSWWAGYLNKGKVVAPKAWHPDGIIRTKLPDHWTVI